MSNTRHLVKVAVPVPLADAFDYLADAPLPAIGCRVRVPFGRGERIGLVVEHPAATDVAPARLKTIRGALDEAPRSDTSCSPHCAGPPTTTIIPSAPC